MSEFKAAGHSLLTLLLQSSPLLKTLLSIIHTGLHQLLQYNIQSSGTLTLSFSLIFLQHLQEVNEFHLNQSLDPSVISVSTCTLISCFRVLTEYQHICWSISVARKPLEQCTLLALQLLNLALDKQQVFLDLLRQTGHSTIVSRMEKLLLGINPKTGQADHLVTISR